MKTKAKITMSIDSDLAEKLSEIGRKKRVSKSRLVEEALRDWERKLLEEELRAGYTAMADEDASSAEDFVPAAAEDLK